MLVGTISELWRYPVSAVGGEFLDAISIAESGVEGDRKWTVVDSDGGPAWPDREKRWRSALLLRARSRASEFEISLADSSWMDGTAPATWASLSDHFGFPVSVRPQLPHGTTPQVDGVRERYHRAPIHIVTSASIAHLQRTLPESSIDSRRFRPNIVLTVPETVGAHVERSWIGRTLRIGDAELQVTEPCARCVFTVLPQGDLPFDKRVLSAIAIEGGGFGVYCSVVIPGRIAVGDSATVRDARL
jgi:MOSC domain-containing protein